MTFPYLSAINLIPASGEFVYDTVAYSGEPPGSSAFLPINTYHAPGGTRTDVMYALDQLQATLPNCTSVALVVQWLGNSLDASACQVYPATTYLLDGAVGAFEPTAGGTDSWRVSDVTLATSGLIPISRPDGVHAVYGGTPSDQSVVRCIAELKNRGFKVALYPMMNMDVTGKPWRGLVTYSPDVSSAATTVVNNFLGTAATSQFTRDATNLTVHYSGNVLDFAYRRFVLHYANLAALAGGVNLFVFGSELRGLEAIRGPAWTPAGTVDGSGNAVWDYPFVAGLVTLANDCRSVFDAAGFTKNLAARENLITYSADWSQWMGARHAGVTGIFPHLDTLFASSDIDFVSIDNYMPLSDWTTGDGGLDARNWRLPPPTSWPLAAPTTLGFGLTGAPDVHRIDYLTANIEGGEKFHYWYGDYASSMTLDPNGTLQYVTAPQGDRLTQARNPYYAGQELFAFKQIRWWWNNTHQAVYDAGDGAGTVPHGPHTQWVPQSKSVGFLEYGFPTSDRCSNEENVFYDPASISGGTPFWSIWNAAKTAPLIDATLALTALQAFWQYWTAPGNNETSSAGVRMIADDLMFAWCWDARPLPEFPLRTDIWSDGADWANGHWLNGKLPSLPPQTPSSAPSYGPFTSFPTLIGQGWSSKVTPRFATLEHGRTSGKSSRRMKMRWPLYEIELTYDFLRGGAATQELQNILGFFESAQGQAQPFWLAPPGLSALTNQMIGTGDGATTVFPMQRATGAFSEPLAGVSSLTAVRVNGAALAPGAWSLSSGYEPSLTLASAPAIGASVNVDGAALWLCRFAENALDFEQFAYNLFRLKSVKLVTVKL
ncbi:MAG: glycoside hydrolase TIM-barrel-like domain-containing protein [Methylocystis sp.]